MQTAQVYTQAQYLRARTAMQTAAEGVTSAFSSLEPSKSDAATATSSHSSAPYDRTTHSACFSLSSITCECVGPPSPDPLNAGHTNLSGVHGAPHNLEDSTLVVVDSTRADDLWPGFENYVSSMCPGPAASRRHNRIGQSEPTMRFAFYRDIELLLAQYATYIGPSKVHVSVTHTAKGRARCF